MSALLNAGQKLVNGLESVRRVLAPLTDRLLDRLTGERITPQSAAQSGMRTFELDAQAVMSTEHTHRAQTLVRSAVLIVVLLITWASLAKIDETTKGEAKVIPSRQLQL